jgi:hypothetical protein
MKSRKRLAEANEMAGRIQKITNSSSNVQSRQESKETCHLQTDDGLNLGAKLFTGSSVTYPSNELVQGIAAGHGL